MGSDVIWGHCKRSICYISHKHFVLMSHKSNVFSLFALEAHLCSHGKYNTYMEKLCFHVASLQKFGGNRDAYGRFR